MNADAPWPRGTVAFLFTDIEGSTALWEADRQAMATAVERHLEILRGCVRSHGGQPFKVVGDALQAAFDSAAQAVWSAAEAQRALAAEAWTELVGRPLRVRMGVHVGEAQPVDGDYLAPCLNRLARLLSAGHGGQVLVSQATAALIEGQLPTDVRLIDLGRHRLRDLLEPERIFQLVAPGLAVDFAPLRTLDSRPNNLPRSTTPLIDRRTELAAAIAQLSSAEVRWLTLTGPGGIGKTRLALQVAAELLDRFEHGVYLVPLESLRDPSLVPSAMAATLGIREGGTALETTIEETLEPREMLLLVDNLEHLSAAGPWLAGLLERCPRLRILATSRSRLGLRAEHLLRLSALDLPAEAGATIAALESSPAGALFLERARAQRPDFILTADNVEAVAAICRRLDGIPLALELAAARLSLLPPAALRERLEHRLPLLAGGAGDRPARHQGLRDTIAWSHDLLPEPARILFRRLSVFRGGFALAAAEAVCAPGLDSEPPIADLLSALAALVDGSLVRPATDDGAEPRFEMMGTIAEFADEQLAAAGELGSRTTGHLEYFLALAERSRDAITGQGGREALEGLDVDQDNLRVALRYAAEQGWAELGLRLAAALWRFWYLRGRLFEGRSRLERALELAADEPSVAHLRARNGAGVLAWNLGDYAAAESHYRTAIQLSLALDQPRMHASLLNNLSILQMDRGEPEAAQASLDEALALIDPEEETNAPTRAGLLHSLGALAGSRDDLEGSRHYFEESLALHRRLGNLESVASSLHNLAELDHVGGDTDGARRRAEEALALARQVGDQSSLAALHGLLGLLDVEAGALDRGEDQLLESLRLRQAVGDRRSISPSLVGLAALAGRRGKPLEAARFLGAAEAARASMGVKPTRRELEQIDQLAARTREGIDPSAFETAWQGGGAEDLDTLVSAILAGRDETEAIDPSKR